ncbi:MAG: hypothetical protein P4L69_19495 [Desulfosporosinus sp.]|nr:hypothetical protein [Desulfosporosinus sp.]
MSNQWGRQPMGMDSRTLVFGIVIIGIIGYMFIPNFFKSVNSSTDPTVTATSPNNVNSSSTNDPNTLNSSGYPIQNLPRVNNTLNNGNGNNEITTGYWILCIYNGTIQQLPINSQDYAFVQGLVNSDTKGSTTNQIFLVENGQIQKYVVSNETYSIIANMATINKRSSNSLPDTYQTPSPTPTTPTLTIPSSSAPSTTVPSASAPSTTVPNTTVPSASAPSTTVPNTTVPSPFNP